MLTSPDAGEGERTLIFLVTYTISPDEISWGEMLVGFAKTLYQEHPGYRGRILGLPKDITPEERIGLIQQELHLQLEQPSIFVITTGSG